MKAGNEKGLFSSIPPAAKKHLILLDYENV